MDPYQLEGLFQQDSLDITLQSAKIFDLENMANLVGSDQNPLLRLKGIERDNLLSILFHFRYSRPNDQGYLDIPVLPGRIYIDGRIEPELHLNGLSIPVGRPLDQPVVTITTLSVVWLSFLVLFYSISSSNNKARK